ncbi:hypothetical protein PENFLA_c067G07222 [Penicillium flavigenum]|uniref:Uncharacterized protein n=1 Tax=Penicillium flavigenum TaxID=254877 RepID=A0A1V6SEB8_9EURO|nr:hypothetical protein PENFLA_c067G07222 [Penicillium flavigenum]
MGLCAALDDRVRMYKENTGNECGCLMPLRNTLDALLPLATHQGTPRTALLFPTHRFVLALGISEAFLLLLGGMGTEWATRNIIISICILIINFGHHHHLHRLHTNHLIMCNTPIHHRQLLLRHRHHLDTHILTLCLLIPLNILILIPLTLDHPVNQIAHQLPNLIHAL